MTMKSRVLGAVAVSRPEWKGVQVGAVWLTVDRRALTIGHTEQGYYPLFHGREMARVSLGRIGSVLFGAVCQGLQVKEVILPPPID
jgi:hypothetical protein